MTSMIINYLLIFDINKKLAKRVDFGSNINIITTPIVDGNDRGKSIIMKNIFHTLGADAIFDDLWDEKSKCSIINLNIDDITYYIYRNNKLFKIYTDDKRKIFQTINRFELGEFLGGIFGFSINLPNRGNDMLEVTPPVYSYVLNYIDQDFLNGSKFSAFNNLSQYADFKENTLYSHFGLFHEEYFEIQKSKKEIENKIRDDFEEKEVIENVLNKIKKYINNTDVLTDVEALKVDLENSRLEYESVTKKLNSLKKTLVSLRNEKINLRSNISELKEMMKNKEKKVSQMNNRICPTCSNQFENIDIMVKEYNTLEDFFVMHEQLNTMLSEVERKTSLAEEKYKNYLSKYNEIEKSLEVKDEEVEDVFEHFGYVNSQKKLYVELGEIQQSLVNNEATLKEIKKEIQKFADLKVKANQLYEQYMIESLESLKINDVSINKVSNIKTNFYSRGSNKPSVTVIWHFNLLKVKKELNPESISFPIVMDSPNNGELDDEKRKRLFDFIFANRDVNTQLILSTLGFNKKDYNNVEIGKLISLENPKYNLLNEEDYLSNINLLNELILNSQID